MQRDTFSYETIGEGELAINQFTQDKTHITQSYSDFRKTFGNSMTIQLGSNTQYIRVAYRYTMDCDNLQLEYGKIRTTYEPNITTPTKDITIPKGSKVTEPTLLTGQKTIQRTLMETEELHIMLQCLEMKLLHTSQSVRKQIIFLLDGTLLQQMKTY